MSSEPTVEINLDQSTSQPAMGDGPATQSVGPIEEPAEEATDHSVAQDHPAEALSDAARIPPPDAQYSPAYSPFPRYHVWPSTAAYERLPAISSALSSAISLPHAIPGPRRSVL